MSSPRQAVPSVRSAGGSSRVGSVFKLRWSSCPSPPPCPSKHLPTLITHPSVTAKMLKKCVTPSPDPAGTAIGMETDAPLAASPKLPGRCARLLSAGQPSSRPSSRRSLSQPSHSASPPPTAQRPARSTRSLVPSSMVRAKHLCPAQCRRANLRLQSSSIPISCPPSSTPSTLRTMVRSLCSRSLYVDLKWIQPWSDTEAANAAAATSRRERCAMHCYGWYRGSRPWPCRHRLWRAHYDSRRPGHTRPHHECDW